MNGPEVAPPQRELQVPAQINAIPSALDQLDGVIGDLEGRLCNVVRNSDVSKATGEDTECLVPLAIEIRNVRDRIMGQVRRVRDIVERLEL